jgi:hypothetical protein
VLIRSHQDIPAHAGPASRREPKRGSQITHGQLALLPETIRVFVWSQESERQGSVAGPAVLTSNLGTP